MFQIHRHRVDLQNNNINDMDDVNLDNIINEQQPDDSNNEDDDLVTGQQQNNNINDLDDDNLEDQQNEQLQDDDLSNIDNNDLDVDHLDDLENKEDNNEDKQEDLPDVDDNTIKSEYNLLKLKKKYHLKFISAQKNIIVDINDKIAQRKCPLTCKPKNKVIFPVHCSGENECWMERGAALKHIRFNVEKWDKRQKATHVTDLTCESVDDAPNDQATFHDAWRCPRCAQGYIMIDLERFCNKR